MTERLPGGDKAWFVRVRKGASRQLTPCAPEGWMVVGGFVAINLLSVLLLLPQPTPARWIAWTTVTILSAVLLIVIAYRMSPPGWRDK